MAAEDAQIRKLPPLRHCHRQKCPYRPDAREAFAGANYGDYWEVLAASKAERNEAG
ncbi:MAG: hypothetical protein ACLRSD_03040 [Oscillibacter sp.]